MSRIVNRDTNPNQETIVKIVGEITKDCNVLSHFSIEIEEINEELVAFNISKNLYLYYKNKPERYIFRNDKNEVINRRTFWATEADEMTVYKEDEYLLYVDFTKPLKICPAKLFFLLILHTFNAEHKIPYLYLSEKHVEYDETYRKSKFLKQFDTPFIKEIAFMNEFEEKKVTISKKSIVPNDWNLVIQYSFHIISIINDEYLLFSRVRFEPINNNITTIMTSKDLRQKPSTRFIEYYLYSPDEKKVLAFFHETKGTQFDVFPFQIKYQQSVSWIINFVHIVANGLISNKTFHEFLTQGVYDPRILLFVVDFVISRKNKSVFD